MSRIVVTDVKDAEIAEQPTFTSRRVIRKAHGAQQISFNVTTLHEGYADPAVTYPDHDEVVHILSGQVELTIDGRTQTLGPGATFFVPRGETYGYKVVTGPNEVIAAFTPGKF